MKNLSIPFFAVLLFLPALLHSQILDWERLYDLPGVQIRSMAGDAGGHLVLECGTGTYRSENKGLNWLRANASTGYDGIRSGRDGQFYRFTSGLVGFSSDKGKTWQSPTPYNADIAQIKDLAVDPAGGYWAATDTAVWYSSDSGLSYHLRFSFPADSLENFSFTDIETDQSGRIYVLSNYAQLFTSHDNGGAWFKAFNPTFSVDFYLENLQVTQQGVLFLSVIDRLYRSDDGGLSWKQAQFPFSFWQIFTFAAVEGTDRVFVQIQQQILRSEDGGATFEAYIPAGVLLTNVSRFFSFSDQVVFFVDKNTFFVSIDGGTTWARDSGGFGDVEVSDIAFPVNDCKQVLAYTAVGVAYSKDAGGSWRLLVPCDGICFNPENFAPLPDGNVWFLVNGKAYRTVPGDSLTVQPVSNLSGGYQAIYSTPQGWLFAKQSTGKFRRSTDNGASWQTIQPPNGTYFNHFVPHPDGSLYVGTGGFGIYRSADAGQTWETVPPATVPGFPLIEALDITPKGTLLAAVGYNGQVFRSVDKGENWEYAQICCNQIFDIVHTHSGACFTSMENRISRSDDDGHSWQDAGEGGGFLAASPGGYLFKTGLTGSDFLGLYRSVEPVADCISSGVNTMQQNDLGVALTPNPAPAGPITVVIADFAGAVQIVVSDFAGRVIKNLALTNGQGLLDCSGWVSGVYFYGVIQAGKVIGHGKLLIH